MTKQAEETQKPIIFAPETYQYDKFTLNEKQLTDDPIDLFTKWFNEAKEDPRETLPEAITFSSAELPSGRVSSRILLLRSSTIEVLLFILTGEPLERLMILLPTRMRQSYSFGRICKGRWELKVSQSMLTEKLLKDTLRRDLVDPRSVHGLPANRMLSRTEKN